MGSNRVRNRRPGGPPTSGEFLGSNDFIDGTALSSAGTDCAILRAYHLLPVVFDFLESSKLAGRLVFSVFLFWNEN